MYLKNLEVHISFIMKKHCCSTLFTKLWSELKVVFINFQILSDIFKSLVALSIRLEQNQWQLSGNITLIKHNQSENSVKRINAGQQLKKPRGKEVSVLSQYKRQTDDRSKENVIYYQCNKKGHYKSQCSELTKKQFKNVNQISVREMCIKGKDQHSQKCL